MIDGVGVEKLKKIETDGGRVMHMLRSDSPLFSTFGELYFSWVNSQAIRAWRKHLVMTQRFAVPVGAIKLVIYDDREKSPTKGKIYELELGEDNYCLVKIPPQLWYGFKGISANGALIANCSDIPYDPNEIIRLDLKDTSIPYIWK